MLLVLWALLSACSASTTRIESRALAPVPEASTDRLIVAAVDNDPAAFVSSAGGTPRGYDSVAPYGPTSRARGIMRSLEKDYGLREVDNWPIEPLKMHCAVLRIPENADRAQLLAKMSSDPRVKLAQPLQTFSTRTYNDPYVELQRGFQRMNVMGAHVWTRGEGVKVGIVDTGADTAHPDLQGKIAAAANFVDADETLFRSDRHGTEMAGVIAAVANNHEGIVGIAPGARILMFKACWQLQAGADAASCNSFTLARALVAALDAHVQVVNLSLDGPDDRLLGDLMQEGLRRGVVFVGAAGALTHRPGVIEVAGDETGPGRDFALHAPGHEILTLLPGGRYDFASGDSIATAQVTGVVALLLAKNPALTPNAVASLLRTSADGVDACQAVAALMGRGSCQTVAMH
jgi:subtilase family protein